MRTNNYFEATGRISFREGVIFVSRSSVMDLPGVKEDTQGPSSVEDTTVLTSTVSSSLLLGPWQLGRVLTVNTDC